MGLSLFFAIASASAWGGYRGLSTFLGRRAAKSAIHRLRPPSSPAAAARRAKPLLIDLASGLKGQMASGILEKVRLRPAAERLLESAALNWSAAGLLHRSVAMFLAGFALVTLLTANRLPLFALAAGGALGAVPLWYVRRRSRRRVAAFEAQFPDCLEFISRTMRAGHAFSVAIEMVPREYSDPVAAEFRRAFEQQNLGQSIELVLQSLSRRVPSMDVHFFVSAVLLQKRTGGNLAELLDKLANLIRERFKLRARIRAISAQGVMSGRILSAIPVAVGLLMFVCNPEYARFFITDPAGNELLAGSIALQFIGYLVIRKIVNIEV